MSEQVQKNGSKKSEEVEEIEEDDIPEPKIFDEIDALLDEIDGVLEDNAEEFVRSYVQKGGQ